MRHHDRCKFLIRSIIIIKSLLESSVRDASRAFCIIGTRYKAFQFFKYWKELKFYATFYMFTIVNKT